ncbi:response regulator [Gynuella sunshinyii]|uniref:diguanylate cyclase n=1 Tax=Gynuella sunshinyii YC6258 TaxID=1445510 RepID=A0A0C5VGK4_9GAMM|nr:response regulator [Gynuella sunshinyii]AJQ93316.1 response regulator containing a CheY-like receiver domain and a GGDEF domain [Gynuella sunshinyii YC6258]
MSYVLLVDDSPVILKILRHLATRIDHHDAVAAASLSQAKQIYQQNPDSCFAAVVDLTLPDASSADIVDYFVNARVPTIVLTGNFDEKLQNQLIQKGIVDYVRKEGRYSYEYAIDLVNRLSRNLRTRVLVVEDSKAVRSHIRHLLQTQLFEVLEAGNGLEALKVLKQHPDIRLLITDYQMPEMDGFELVLTLRHKLDRQDMVIIGLSSTEEANTSTRFIKNGANDFLSKPFNSEEFHCRINRNMDNLYLLERVQAMAYEDDLTGLPNRRWFYEHAEPALALTNQHHKPFCLALLSLDDYQALNDAYGRDLGDQLLTFFALELRESFPKQILARTGVEEFTIVFPGQDQEQCGELLNRFKQHIAVQAIEHGEEEIFITFTAGIASQPANSLDNFLLRANNCLLEAKRAGSNMIFGEE